MSRALLILAALAVVATACTSSEGSDTSVTTVPPTNAPVTTLPPTESSSSTTTAPSETESTTTTTEAIPENECTVGPDSSVEGYTKGCTVLGIPMLAGEDVDDDALLAQADRVYNMLLFRPDLQASFIETAVEGRVIPAGTRIDDLPEYADLYDQYPGTDWRRRGRSFAGTELVPYFSGAEENLLCSADDFYEGEDIFVRTFALTIRRFGLDIVDPPTSRAIDQAYGRAIAAGLWTNTLAEINEDEYWMEGVQSFFDANIEDDREEREPNSSHNEIDTREELADYDPTLYAIAASVFGEGDWRPGCP